MLKQLQPAHDAGVSSLCVSPDGLTLAVTSLDNTTSLWDIRTWNQTARLAGHRDCVNCSIFTTLPGTGIPALITGGDDRVACVWDVRNLAEPLAVVKGFNDGVDKFSISTDGCFLYSACDDGLVYCHSLAAPFQLQHKWMVSANTANDVVVVAPPAAPGTDLLLTAGEDSSVRSWRTGPVSDDEDGTPDRLLATLDEFDHAVNHIVRRGPWVFAAVAECVFAFDFCPESGQFGSEGRTFSGHTDYVRGIELVAETTMLTVSDDKTAIEWDITSCQVVRQVKLHDEMVMAMAVIRDGGDGTARALISGCEDGTVRVWALPFQTQRADEASAEA